MASGGAGTSANRSIRLAVAGDVMLGRTVDEHVQRGADPLSPWGDLLDELRGADLTIGNLECCISTRGEPWDPSHKPFHFRAGPWAAASLRSAGFDYLSLANNHALDFGVPALEDTLDLLDAAGIAHAGAGRTVPEAYATVRQSVAGWSVAVLAAADHPRDFAVNSRRPGTRVVRMSADDPEGEALLRGVESARAGVGDLVIASLHWGPNMNRDPVYPAFARALVDAGAHLVHGHSAHVFQGVEVYRGSPILYDTGDFVDDYVVDPVLRNDLQFLFILEFGAAGLERLELIPIRIDRLRVRHADAAERRWLFDTMRSCGSGFGTTWEDTEGRLVLSV